MSFLKTIDNYYAIFFIFFNIKCQQLYILIFCEFLLTQKVKLNSI